MKLLPALAAVVLLAGCSGGAPTTVATEPEPSATWTSRYHEDGARHAACDSALVALDRAMRAPTPDEREWAMQQASREVALLAPFALHERDYDALMAWARSTQLPDGEPVHKAADEALQTTCFGHRE